MASAYESRPFGRGGAIAVTDTAGSYPASSWLRYGCWCSPENPPKLRHQALFYSSANQQRTHSPVRLKVTGSIPAWGTKASLPMTARNAPAIAGFKALRLQIQTRNGICSAQYG